PAFLRRESEIAHALKRGYRVVRWAYGDVAPVGFQFARGVGERGVGKGERLPLWGGDCCRWGGWVLGGARRGAGAVPVDRISSPDFARRVAEQVEAKLLIGSPDALVALPNLRGFRFEALRNDLAGHSPAPYTPTAVTRDDIAEIIFTSGTTAEPR